MIWVLGLNPGLGCRRMQHPAQPHICAAIASGCAPPALEKNFSYPPGFQYNGNQTAAWEYLSDLQCRLNDGSVWLKYGVSARVWERCCRDLRMSAVVDAVGLGHRVCEWAQHGIPSLLGVGQPDKWVANPRTLAEIRSAAIGSSAGTGETPACFMKPLLRSVLH